MAASGAPSARTPGERRLTLDSFYGSALDDGRGLALFLDLDGTLIDIAPTPGAAVAPPGLVGLLEQLSRTLGGALAIISGRPIADLDRLLAPALPCAAGVHGAEIREISGGPVKLVAPRLEAPFIEAVRRQFDSQPGVIVEAKSASVAVHYRQAQDRAPEIEQMLRALLPQSADALDLRPGRKVAEVLQKHVSKGAAVQSFMHRPPFSDRLPIMIGDDATDVSAFEAVESFGGRGLRVAGEFFDEAQADFGGTYAVRQWLDELSDRIAAVRSLDGR